MSRPWMAFYVADYLRDTRRLTAAEHGAYLLLIMEYWASRALPNDDRQLARIACMSAAEWRRARPTLQAFFHDGWRHRRLDAEIAKAEAKYERRSEAGKRGGLASANAKQHSSNAAASSSQPQSQPSSLRSGRTRASALVAPWTDADCERFWAEFPNKIGKADAMRAFVKASHKTTPDVLFPALQRYARKTDDRPYCNPSTWLNQERWLDQPAVSPRGTGPPRPAGPQGFETLFQNREPQTDDTSPRSEFDLDLTPSTAD